MNNKWFSNLLPAIENTPNAAPSATMKAGKNTGVGDAINKYVLPAATLAPLVGAAPALAQIAPAVPAIMDNIGQSPIGEAVQGHFDKVIPALQKAVNNIATGKTQVMFGGEMEETPGFTMKNVPQNLKMVGENTRPGTTGEATIEGPLTKMGSYTRDGRTTVNPNFKPNPNPTRPQFSQEFTAPSSGMGPNDLPNGQLPPITDEVPVKPSNPGPVRTYSATNASAEDILNSQKRNIQIDGHDIKTPANVKQINSTLNGYGIKGSLTDQLQAANDQVEILSKKAKQMVTQQGGSVPKQPLIQDIKQKLSYGVGHNIPPKQAENAASTYLNHVYIKAIGGDVTSGIVVPDQIPGPILQDMKTIMNTDAKSTWGQTDSTKWSLDQTVSRYGRDAVDATLDSYYPNASTLNNDMSDLIKAQDSLTKGANAEGGVAQKAANAPKEPSFIDNLRNKPLRTALGVGAAGIGLKELLPPIIGGATLATQALGNIPQDIKDGVGNAIASNMNIGGFNVPSTINQFANGMKSNAQNNKGQKTKEDSGQVGNHTSIVAPDVNHLPQSAQEIQVSPNGDTTILNPYTSGLAIDQKSYSKQKTDLNNQIAQLHQEVSNNPQDSTLVKTNEAKISALSSQLSSLEANNTTSRTLDTPYNNARNIVSGTKNTLNDLNKSGTNLLQSNGTINNTVFKTDPDYSALVSSIDYLQKQSGITVYQPGISAEALKNNILQAEKILLYNTYYSQLGGSYTGGATNLPVITGNQSSAPAPTTQLPPITGSNSGTGVAHPFVY